jgi:hypothetical protein
MKKLMTLLLAGMMLLGMVTVANATTISYIYNGGIVPFGTSDTAVDTAGQTFRLSEEDIDIGDDNFLDLDSVTFWITGDIEFKFYLYKWDGSKITGDPLFAIESGQLSPVQKDDFQEFTVDLDGIVLNVYQDYVFFVSASAGSGSIATREYIHFPGFPLDPTPDHKLVYNDGSTEWYEYSFLSPFPYSADMAFEMVLSAYGPEPEPDATFEITKAKVDLKKGKIKLDGQVVLPEDVTYDTYEDLYRQGSVKLHLFELDQLVEVVEEVVDDLVYLEVKGRKGEKWQYKNRHAFGVTEYKVHWKDDQTGKVKIKADFDPGSVDLSQLTPKLVVKITLGDLLFDLTIAENGQYDCKLKRKKWDFRNKRNKP